MHIRTMTLADYDAVYALWKATPGMGLHPHEDSREGIAYFLRRNPDSCFVAEEGGEITGAVLCGNDGRRGYLSHMAVAQSHRRRGVGRALLEACLVVLRRERIRRCVLVAFLDNDTGRAFWTACGFKLREDLGYFGLNL